MNDDLLKVGTNVKREKIFSYRNLMKAITPLVFATLMMINLNSYAQTNKRANYG